MSISAYVGLPGSGKSYGVFENVIIPALEKKIEVWTNIPTNNELLLEKYGYAPTNFNTQDILEDPTWFQNVLPKGVIIVIDECWRLWASGLKANNAIEGHKSFLAEHRHMVGANGRSTEIYLVTQDLAQIASFARNLIEHTYRAEKLSRVGQHNKYRIDVYFGPVTGPSPPKSKLDNQIYGRYKKEIYELYSSHTMSETGSAGDETKTDQRFNVLKGGWLKGYGIVVVAGIVCVFLGIAKVKAYFEPEAEEAPVQVVETALSPPVELETTLAPPPVVEKKRLDVFDGREFYISFNRGNFPDIEYVVRLKNGNNSFDLTLSDLYAMDYSVKPINECLLVIGVNHQRYMATCKSSTTSNGLVNFDWKVDQGEG